MMTALVVSMSGLFALRGLGLVTFPASAGYLHRWQFGRWTDIRYRHGAEQDIARVLVPPVAGEGKMDYIVPGLLGFLTGAVIYGLTYQTVFPAISAIANYGSVVIPDLWNLSPFLFIRSTLRIDVGLPVLYDRSRRMAEKRQNQ